METSTPVGSVTFGGMPLTLVGESIAVGAKAPDFTVLDASLSPVRLSDFVGNTVILVSVPSLDTPVCDIEARIFNQRVSGLGSGVVVLVISMDLPFAQSRWCAASGVEQVIAVSDHRDASFGQAYGMLIAELRLLARAIFLIDRDGVLRYRQVVPELGHEPDYEDVIAAVSALA